MIYPGERAFEMKATFGLPLEMVFHSIIVLKGGMIEWPSFIERARKNGWWDFQTIDEITENLNGALIDRELSEQIIGRCKQYCLDHPYPPTPLELERASK